MRLTKEQYDKRKGCILKAHLWFCTDVVEKVFKNFDFYEADTMVYVFEKVKA